MYDDRRGDDLNKELLELRRRVSEFEGIVLARQRKAAQTQRAAAPFRLSIDAIPVNIAVKDRNHRFLEVNQAFADLSGISPDRIVGQTVADVFPGLSDALQALYVQNEDDVLSSGEARKGIIESYPVKGRSLWLWTDKSPYKDAHGNIIGVLELSIDISPLKQAEQDLKESENTYRLILDNAGEGIIIIQDEIIEYANSGASEITGYGAEEMLSVAFSRFVHAGDRDVLSEQQHRRAQGGERATYRLRVINRSGAAKWLEIRESSVQWQGRGAALCAFTDITERKTSEDALRIQVNMLNQVEDPLISVDLKGVMTSWNRGAETVFGYGGEEVRDRYVSLLYPEWQRTFFEREIVPLISESGKYEAEIVGKKKSGEDFVAYLNLSPLRDEGGALSGVIIRHVDAGRRLEYSDHVLQTQKMEAVGELAAGFAGDFNNILSVIVGSSSLLRMKMNKDDPLVQYANKITAAAERGANLTQSLLAFSRKQIMTLKPAELSDFVRSKEVLLAKLIPHGIELKTEYCADKLFILADDLNMSQVLVNIIDNAREAMAGGGKLLIKTERASLDGEFVKTHGFGKIGTYALLSMADTGEGMDEATKKRAFDPFFTTKDVGKSLGLGLSVAYGIVKQHNGFIVVESQKGEGTTFEIFLPLIQ